MIYLDNDGDWWTRDGEYVGGGIEEDMEDSLTDCIEVFHQHLEDKEYTYAWASSKYGVSEYVIPMEFIK